MPLAMETLTIFLPSLTGYSSLVIPAIIVCVATVYQAFFAVRYPANLPLFGEPDGKRYFSWRTRWRYYTDCAALYRETYDKYTSKGKTVLLPGLGFRHDIIMPQSAMKWVLARPESELSHAHAILEVVQLKHALGHEKYKLDPWPGVLVKTEVNAKLESVCADMHDELVHALERHLGSDAESWKEIDLLATVRMVVAQAASRFTVGIPLCRNEEYLRDCWRVADGIVLNGGLTGATPRALRPLFGPLFSWNLHRNTRKIKKHFAPLYHERLQSLQHSKGEHPEPQDLLQMMLRYAQRERPAELHDLDSMTARLCFANFGAMHQTSMLATNLLLDILGSDPAHDTIAVLRAEAARVLGAPSSRSARWTKQTAAQLVRADSAARETLRLHSYSNRGLFRKVVATDGLLATAAATATADDVRLPRGAYLSFLAHPPQCDAAAFADPFRYDPFRFSRAREEAAAADAGGLPGLSFVATSPHHLPFGHGAHSCPGRFLVDFEVKMLIVHVLGCYDLEFPAEYGGVRPPNRWVAEALAPPAGARIKVRRRKGVAAD